MIEIIEKGLKRLLSLPFGFCRWGVSVERYLRRRIALAKTMSPLAKLVPLRKRLWAMTHGFHADRILFYGLNKHNVERYMSDFIHESLHPINGRFSHIIDDKTHLPFLLKDFPEHSPTYYFLIYDGEMIDLSLTGKGTNAYDPNSLLSFMKMNTNYIIKPLGGGGGAKDCFELKQSRIRTLSMAKNMMKQRHSGAWKSSITTLSANSSSSINTRMIYFLMQQILFASSL